jgi:molecular chaperone GrpE
MIGRQQKKVDPEEYKNEPYRLQVSQKIVIYNPEDQTFLLVKDVNENNFFSVHYGPWELPGGRMQKGDTLESNIARELKEELGPDLQYSLIDAVAAIGIEYHAGKAVAIGHLAQYLGGDISLSQEHSEYKWETAKTITEHEGYKPWLKTFIAKAQKKIDEMRYLDGWRRCQADFENFRKRHADAHKEMIQFSNMNLINQILPVIDNFHASTAHIPGEKENDPWVTGIMYIQKQLEDLLGSNGVIEIPVNVGDQFDPRLHEAIQGSECSQESKECQNIIQKVVQKGYMIGGRVIRPARVIVE